MVQGYGNPIQNTYLFESDYATPERFTVKWELSVATEQDKRDFQKARCDNVRSEYMSANATYAHCEQNRTCVNLRKEMGSVKN